MRLRSIEHKIFLLILPICLIPSAAFFIFLGVGSRLTFQEAIGLELGKRAEILTERFDQFLAGKYGTLAGLVAQMGADPGQQGKLATEARRLAAVEAVLQIDARKQCRIVPGQSGPDRDFALALRGDPAFSNWCKDLPAPPKNGLFTDYQLSLPGHPGPMGLFILALPDPGGGQWLFIQQSEHLVREFRRGLPQDPDPFMIYSSRGFILYPDQDLDEALASRIRGYLGKRNTATRWFSIKGDNNKDYLIAPAASKYMRKMHTSAEQSATWLMLLPYDTESFLGPLDSYFWLSIVFTLGMALVLIGLAWLAARHIVGPLLTLRRQAESLAMGNLEVRASVRSGDEIGDLAEAFNTMATRLRTTYRALEERLEDNQLQIKHINVINEITGAIIQVLSPDSIFEILCREVGKVLSFDALWVALFDEDERDLRLTHIHPNMLFSLFDRGRIPLANSLHGHAVELGETLHAELGPQHRTEDFESCLFKAEGFQSYLIAPLHARNRIIGTLTIASTAPDALNSRMVPMMTSLASAVAIAIEQTALFQRTSQFAVELEHKVDNRTHELELANQKLIQAEKYFATGRLAGNLAHEINNPLAIIKNYIQIAKNNLKQAEGGRRRGDMNLQPIEIIDEEVNRIARLVRQMLDLHRPVEQIVRPIDINAMIEEILLLMEENLKNQQIAVVRELAAGLPQPVASPDLIRQVLINLIRNAQDAMEAGGVMTLRTSAVTEWTDGAERETLRIRVSDTGCGIAPEHLSQIFDPFFSTKPPEKGTGLGLCVSYSIVSMYHGTIDVESEVGLGTTVVVALPVESRDEEGSA